MRGFPVFPASAFFVFTVVAIGGGCSFGESGIAPPTNRVFLPTGLAPDPDDDFLYVVNSNSDLRFNAGTVVAVDLALAALVRSCATAASANANTGAPLPAACKTDPALGSLRLMCTKTRFSRTEPQPDNYCCVDMIDSNILNCNEPQFIQSNATIQIGSFGGAVQLQRYYRDPNVLTSEVIRRLFVAVRAEPSITFADVTVAANRVVSMRCKGPRVNGPVQPEQGFCDDNWKVRRSAGDTPGALDLPEEPHVMAMDNALGALYVGHLTVAANAVIQGGGVSTLDICNPQSESSVRFAGLASTTFIPSTLSQAVAALSPGDPAYPTTRLYATARYSTAISGMVLRTPTDATCDESLPAPIERDLTLVAGESFYSSAFYPRGADIRGILFSADDTQAYVLHRNDANTSANPAALVVIDRLPLGTPANTPVDVLEVCGGPTAMQMHDAGRGNRIYITCYDDGQIYVVDPVALVVTSIIDAGAGPIGLVFSPRDPGVGYIASYANSHLSVIDLVPGSPTENHVVMRIGLPHGYGE